MRRVAGAWLVCCALLASAPAAAQVQPGGETVESGTFHIFKLQSPVGVERYAVRREGNELRMSVRTEIDYLGSTASGTATLVTSPDLVPQRFAVSGQTSTMTRTDQEVEVGAGSARVRDRAGSRRVKLPRRFFTASHYGPHAIGQALYRHWRRSGRPERVPLLPSGSASFELRGRDTVIVGSAAVPLDRYSVRGLVWGSQTAWFDADGRLIAAVYGDAELDRLEAVREGFESALPLFVERSVRDGIADLERVARRTPPVVSGHFAIVGARLVDGTGAPPVDDATVVVHDGRIAAAGPRSKVAVPPGVPLVEARGSTLLPGLWDMHAHYEQAEWPLAALAAGVTTARDVANEFELATALRDAIRDGRALGPRMLLAGVVDGGEHPLGVILARDAEEARRSVHRYKNAGFQQIKVYQSVPPEVVPVIAEEAHRLGMTITGHVPTGMNAVEFVRAGADQINHLGSIVSALRAPDAAPGAAGIDLRSERARAVLDLFRERGTVLEPSLARMEQHAHPTDSAYARFEPGVAKTPLELQEALNTTGAAADRAERTMASLARALALVGELHRAGIPIVLGSDLAVPGHSIHRELELAVAAGLSPMEAILAATSVPARVMGMDAEVGTVEVGKRADLLLVRGDPLADMRAIRDVRLVIADGRGYEPAPLWRSVGFRP